MIARTILMFTIIGFTTPAMAQATLQVTKRDCQRLIRHSPSADVAYKPGVDVRGKRVAPADMHGGSPIKLPKEITIPITVDLAERYGFDDKGMSASSTMGKVTVKGGQAYWNGKPLNGGDQAGIEAACKQAGY
ncbi:hypothetical protein [Magnetospira sp. QH-2]|uniref:hypothetical protein n=1 Tax=Magnetospira sp. (strain QH-2) TaxID=1288970 RepID=UPI0003E81122|nr:hypothetical protein [Magnetospira sp. QH-2]CCQ73903.1 Conserved exported protein of unknown function [Magnetospira sp. QH-2]